MCTASSILSCFKQSRNLIMESRTKRVFFITFRHVFQRKFLMKVPRPSAILHKERLFLTKIKHFILSLILKIMLTRFLAYQFQVEIDLKFSSETHTSQQSFNEFSQLLFSRGEILWFAYSSVTLHRENLHCRDYRSLVITFDYYIIGNL